MQRNWWNFATNIAYSYAQTASGYNFPVSFPDYKKKQLGGGAGHTYHQQNRILLMVERILSSP